MSWTAVKDGKATLNRLAKPVNEQYSILLYILDVPKAPHRPLKHRKPNNVPIMSLYARFLMMFFVAAVYSHQWYNGKVTDKDGVEHEVQVNSMTKSGKYVEIYVTIQKNKMSCRFNQHLKMEICPPHPPVPFWKKSKFIYFLFLKSSWGSVIYSFQDYCLTP